MNVDTPLSCGSPCAHATQDGIKYARTEADTALVALLGEYTTNTSLSLKFASIVGLGLAYAGSHREDLLALLLPAVVDESTSTEIAALAALSLGFVFVGSGNGEITSTILQTLMASHEKSKSLGDKWGRFLALGLVLLVNMFGIARSWMSW